MARLQRFSGFQDSSPRSDFKAGGTTGKSAIAGGPDVTLSARNSRFTGHADFVNAWQQTELTQLVRYCLNALRTCGVGHVVEPGGDDARESFQIHEESHVLSHWVRKSLSDRADRRAEEPSCP